MLNLNLKFADTCIIVSFANVLRSVVKIHIAASMISINFLPSQNYIAILKVSRFRNYQGLVKQQMSNTISGFFLMKVLTLWLEKFPRNKWSEFMGASGFEPPLREKQRGSAPIAATGFVTYRKKIKQTKKKIWGWRFLVANIVHFFPKFSYQAGTRFYD